VFWWCKVTVGYGDNLAVTMPRSIRLHRIFVRFKDGGGYAWLDQRGGVDGVTR
jgi:hypothetical protein